MGSCVFYFLKDHCQGKDVIFYSDNCTGQNKNKYMAAMYLYTVQKYNLPSITHKFLIPGHTQNEGDSMHSCIEREKKRVLKSGPIYVPTQWVSVIGLAKKQGKPYAVKEMTFEDFCDLRSLTTAIGTNFSLNREGQKVSWKYGSLEPKIIKKAL